MITPSDANGLLKQALREAMQDGPAASGPHPIDDEDLLWAWSDGVLSPAEHAALLDHLADCPPCRQEIAAMVRAGALLLPGMEDDELANHSPPVGHQAEPANRDPKDTKSKIPNQKSAIGVLVLAASLLLSVVGGWWLLSLSSPQALIARAERQLEQGDPHSALETMERLWDKGVPADQQHAAARIMAQAGVRLGERQLAREEFNAVLQTEHRVSRRAGRTAGLANLKLQAQRGVPAAESLARAGRLTDYGYELDGYSLHKSLPILDETAERLDADFQQALAEFPHDAPLWLNRGHFLLGLSRLEEARQCFQRVIELAPGTTEHQAMARLGLGLVAFELDEPAEALEHFNQAVLLDPQDASAELNAAIALEQLERPDEAQARFQRAARLTTDPVMRQRIAMYLDAGND